MKKTWINFANVFARLSVPLWCRFGIVRRCCRMIYWWIMIDLSAWLYTAKNNTQGKHEKVHQSSSSIQYYDTYPFWDKRFAPWPEKEDTDDPAKHNFVVSKDNTVIRRSPSYVGWKYFEYTGRWLKKPSRRCDAKDWEMLLELNGYYKIVPHPLTPTSRYIGIMPEVGEFGQVVWFEAFGHVMDSPNTNSPHSVCACYHSDDGRTQYFTIEDEVTSVVCSTYNNFQFELLELDMDREDVVWVELT